MKRFAFLALLIPIIASSQKPHEPTDKEVAAAYQLLQKVDGGFEWTEVVQVDSSMKRDDLYRNAKLFFTNEFKSAKDVIQYDDRNEGRVVGKGNFHLEDGQSMFLVFFTDKRDVNFTLEVYCKDGRYKYRIFGINASCIRRASGGSSPDNVSRQDLSIDGAYSLCGKGATKKMDRRLFMLTLAEIQSTIDDLKKAMAQRAKDDF